MSSNSPTSTRTHSFLVGKDCLFLILKELEDYPRTQLRQRKAAGPFNAPRKRTRVLEAKLERQFFNSSRWVRFQKTFNPFDQQFVSKLAERLSCDRLYGILKCASAYVEFLCKTLKKRRRCAA